jgi:hypothetical protein
MHIKRQHNGRGEPIDEEVDRVPGQERLSIFFL